MSETLDKHYIAKEFLKDLDKEGTLSLKPVEIEGKFYAAVSLKNKPLNSGQNKKIIEYLIDPEVGLNFKTNIYSRALIAQVQIAQLYLAGRDSEITEEMRRWASPQREIGQRGDAFPVFTREFATYEEAATFAANTFFEVLHDRSKQLPRTQRSARDIVDKGTGQGQFGPE